MPQTSKPPLGIMPRRIHVENRIDNLQLAMKRYDEFDWNVPMEWLSELSDLKATLQSIKTPILHPGDDVL